MTKTCNFDIKCQINSESYDCCGFYGTKLNGGQYLLFTMGDVSNETESTLGLTGWTSSYSILGIVDFVQNKYKNFTLFLDFLIF